MRVFNVLDGDLAIDEDDPGKYKAPYAKVRDNVGAQRLAGTVVELGEGAAVCPYHYEVIEEEWLFVLGGTPSVRTPDGTEVLEEGDVVCFARGPEGAHQIFNAAAQPARILIVSERAVCAASVYEDSDKVGIYAPGIRHLFRRSDERDYYDGEDTA